MSIQKESSRPFHLYLSYAWNDERALDEFRTLLQRERFKPTISILSPAHSANQADDERALYHAIKTKIKFCDAVVMLGGEYVKYGRWINKELIACRDELRKPVVFVRREKSEPIPFIFKQHADTIVDWDAEAIVSAIRQLAGRRS
ncbi:TIR domain-containing protein [Cohnella rhizosphaerae]|uniref:Toll/interleukin-1 receptor domain-containing protein n=1 Tax=Cohnella rhizosphaerae TaxID=1457232 RepID=A0A9X4QU91_9BACL|nr:TIR domain-containing protein [Cohnella rhizosphaerae]MDG0811229.1 toll/interleukin-1 receptor domain-containing protein [Cohnella rhizosphaerae]